MIKDAYISECKKYRYILSRGWDNWRKSCLFIMLNPSTADANIDDPTIKRCMGFAKKFGFGSFHVVNLFSYRATDPKDLKAAEDPIGSECDAFIEMTLNVVDKTILAWGNHGSYLNRDKEVLSILARKHIRPYCLGITKSSQPKHPLYLSNNTELIEYGSQNEQ